MNLFTTPRKLVKSLQVPNDDYSESVSSTEDIIPPIPNGNGNGNLQASQELVPETKVRPRISSAVGIASGLFVVLIAVVCFLWVRDLDEGCNLVPT